MPALPSVSVRAGPARVASALLVAALAGLTLLPGCDNPACIFGGDCDGSGSDGVGANPATIPTDGTWIVPDAPEIVKLVPTGTDVDRNSPLVVIFSESMSPQNLNIAFELVAEGAAGGSLPFAVTSLIGEGRVLVLVPLTPLIPATTFTLRFREGVNFQDLTGQVVGQPSDRVVGSFTTAAADAAAPRLLLGWPEDQSDDQSATGEILAIFSRPIAANSVVDASFIVTVNGVAPANDPVAQPLVANGGLTTDTRVYRYRSVDPSGVPVPFANDGNLNIELSPNSNQIRDTGGNVLATTEFEFQVASFQAPAAATLTSNPTDAIGINQLDGPADLALQVGLPDGQNGDQLLVTIFGTRIQTEPNPPLIALQRTLDVDAPFTTFTLTAGDLDLVATASPLAARVADGAVGFAVQLKRGARLSPVRMLDIDPAASGVQSPVLDTVAPTLTGLGTSGTAVGTFRSDLRDLAIVGRASEPLRSVLVQTIGQGDNDFNSDGVPPVAGAHRSGLFVAAPVTLGLLAAQQSVAYDVTIFDRALNSGGTTSGAFRQLGASGPGAPLVLGPLLLEVYDETTLQPISGAVVFTHEDDTGTVTFVDTGTTDPAGELAIGAGVLGDTILTVFATGYDIFTFDGVPTDRLSVGLRPTALSDGGVDGQVVTDETSLNLFTKGVADSRTLPSADRISSVSACTFDQTASRFECPFGPTTVRAREIGAQSTLAVQVPTSLFLYSPLTFLHGFALALPLPEVAPGDSEGSELEVSFLLSAADTDPEERAVDGPPLLLSTTNYPTMVGSPRVTVEAVAAGVRGTAVVGQGVAFDLAPPSTNWAARAAYAGAADGIQDVVGDALGRLVQSRTLGSDLMVRLELVDQDGHRAGARPRFSSGPVSETPPAPPLLDPVTPIALNVSGEALDVTFADTLPDSLGMPGIYRVSLTDTAGRVWHVWKRDRSDLDGPNNVVHLPLIGPGLTLPVSAGDLETTVSVFAWAGLDISNLLWSDVEREFHLYAHTAPAPLTPP